MAATRSEPDEAPGHGGAGARLPVTVGPRSLAHGGANTSAWRAGHSGIPATVYKGHEALTQTITMVWVVALVPADRRGSALGPRLAGNRLGQVAVPGLAGAAGIAPVCYLRGVLAGIAAVVARCGR